MFDHTPFELLLAPDESIVNPLIDLKRANERNAAYLWETMISAVTSLLIPIVGLVTTYSGYKLTDIMTRSWVGYVLAVVGLTNVTLWVLYLLVIL